MKNIIPFVLLAFISICSCKTDMSNNKYADVMSCEVRASYFAMIDSTDRGMLIQKFIFDGEGYVKEMLRYGLENEVVGRFPVEGKENPFPVSEDGNFHDTTVVYTTYNINGKIIGQQKKEFSKSGLITEVQVLDNEGKVIGKNSYEYNERNLIKNDIYWDVDLNVPYQVVRYYYEYFNEEALATK